MKHYTEIVPFDLAKKLKESGYPQDLYTTFAYNDKGELIEWIGKSTLTAPSYADVFDWLIEQGMCISVYAINLSDGIKWISHLMDIEDNGFDGSFGYKDSFEDAVSPALEKALELIN